VRISIRVTVTLSALAILGVGWLPGCGSGGGFSHHHNETDTDGGPVYLPDGALAPDGYVPPPPDGSMPPPDTGVMPPPPCDAGPPGACGTAVGPTVTASCTSCGTMSTCQANGCYGGWWCDTATNKCEPMPTSCPPSPCGSGGSAGSGGTGGTGGAGGSGGSGGTGGSGGGITCASPGTYTKNGGSCGSERWNIKTGTDTGASSVSLVPSMTTIATLAALPAAGGGSSRESPTETTLFQLTDVTLTEIKIESDSDYHMVLSDGSNTMIGEIPYPTCDTGSVWSCFIQRSRSEVDAKYSVSSSWLYPSQTVTVRGVGFFDVSHGQTGAPPNAIELHPVLQICFGKGCTPS
jgi:hypothetical protein